MYLSLKPQRFGKRFAVEEMRRFKAYFPMYNFYLRKEKYYDPSRIAYYSIMFDPDTPRKIENVQQANN